MQRRAQLVAINLGNDRRSRYRLDQRIAPDNRLGQHVERGQAVAIHQHLDRPQPKTFDRPLHGEHRGLQDVDAVYFLDTGLSHGTAQCIGKDLVVQAFAL